MAKRIKKRKPRVSVWIRLRGYFLTGLLYITPIAVTAAIIWWVVGLVDSWVAPLIPGAGNPDRLVGKGIPGTGVFFFLLFTTLVGYFMRGFVGRQVTRLTEGVFNRLPVVRSLYNGIKQIAETILRNDNKNFEAACLIEYPRPNSYAIGFITKATKGELPQKVGRDLVSIFVPTTPNPTSGFLLFLPRADVRVLDMTIEEAAKLIISAGLVEPGDLRELPIIDDDVEDAIDR